MPEELGNEVSDLGFLLVLFEKKLHEILFESVNFLKPGDFVEVFYELGDLLWS